MKDLVPIEYEGQRLLTGKQLAEFYGTTTQRLKDNFHKAKKHFVLGRDYFLLEGDVLKEVKESVAEVLFSYPQPLINPLAGATRSVRVYTVEGAARHCKMLNTPKAWEVFNELVTGYFDAQAETMEPPPTQADDDLRREVAELKEMFATLEFTFKEMLEGSRKQLSPAEKAAVLTCLALTLPPEQRQRLVLAAANLILGKALF